MLPADYVHAYEKEEGRTSSLLARLTRSIWHNEYYYYY